MAGVEAEEDEERWGALRWRRRRRMSCVVTVEHTCMLVEEECVGREAEEEWKWSSSRLELTHAHTCSFKETNYSWELIAYKHLLYLVDWRIFSPRADPNNTHQMQKK